MYPSVLAVSMRKVPLPPTSFLQLQKHCEPVTLLEGSAHVLSA